MLLFLKVFFHSFSLWYYGVWEVWLCLERLWSWSFTFSFYPHSLITLFCWLFRLKCIGLYTPINYFGRYATCSHNKDGGRSHIQSRETIGQENHVTCLKLRPRVNFRPAFGASYKTRIFYKYVVFKHPFSFTKFLRSGSTLPPVWINRSEKQQHGWASQTFKIYIDYETLSSLIHTACF